MKSALIASVVFSAVVATVSVAAAAPIRPVSTPTFSAAAMHGNLLSAVRPGSVVDVYISLPGQHAEEIDRFIAAVNTPGSPLYGRYLSPEGYGRYFGANPTAYARAIASLRLHGFAIDDLPANRTDIVAHATAAIVTSYFQTPIDLHVENGRIFFANRYEPVMPPELSGAAVSGLENYFVRQPMLRQRPNAIVRGYFSWGPPDIAAAYDLNPLYAAGLDGKGITIANATFGAATTSALALFQKQFKLPSAALITTGVPSNFPVSTQGNGESTLDVDAALGVAREATFHQVVAHSTSNHSFDLVYGYIVNNLGSTVHVVTTSWGICERQIKSSSSLSIDEKLLAQAATEGQYWFSAAGDSGSNDCGSGGSTPSVDYPGSSRYVMSVGGTNVKAAIVKGNVTAWQSETTWQFSNSNGAGGGGRSILFKKPSYQTALSPKDGVRDVPDVSLLSDDVNDGMWIAIGNQLEGGNGGTSEAAPQWAALLAIVAQKKGKAALVDPHVRLYQLAGTAAYKTIFHDITVGNNAARGFPGFSAGPGFDLATGLGSFIGAALVKAY